MLSKNQKNDEFMQVQRTCAAVKISQDCLLGHRKFLKIQGKRHAVTLSKCLPNAQILLTSGHTISYPKHDGVVAAIVITFGTSIMQMSSNTLRKEGKNDRQKWKQAKTIVEMKHEKTCSDSDGPSATGTSGKPAISH